MTILLKQGTKMLQLVQLHSAQKSMLLSTSTQISSKVKDPSGFKIDPKDMKDILLTSTKNGVTTMTMNTPKKLNGWTGPMMLALKDTFAKLAKV